MITLGTYESFPQANGTVDILYEPSQAAANAATPWSRAYIAQRLGMTTEAVTVQRPSIAEVSDAQLACHMLINGSSGSGKSRFIHHILMGHLRSGGSVALVEPKGETKANLLPDLPTLNMDPSKIILINPEYGGSIPGWNPFKTDLPVMQSASDFVAVTQQLATSWGPRLQDILTNAAIIIAEHRLSVYELTRFLAREDYREALLQVPVRPENAMAYSEAVNFFRDEMAVWGRSERANAIGPVLNKLREFLRSTYLRPLLGAETNTFDLADLWREQRLVVAHVDRAQLGEAGAQLLSGMLTNQLFRTALRMPGKNRVLLVIDELATMEKFMGKALIDIVTVARSLNLRLLVACQHLNQLTPDLREALLANCTVQAYFKLGYEDARLVASSLSAGAPSTITRYVANYEREARAEWRHRILNASGLPLRLPNDRWKRFAQEGVEGRKAILRLLALGKASGFPRLYVRSADRNEPVEISTYIAGTPDADYSLDGPSLELVVTFPRPRLTSVERTTASDVASAWTRELQNLPRQRMALRCAGVEPGIVKVVNVEIPEPSAKLDQFLSAAYAANGQNAAEVARVLRERAEAVQRLATGSTNVDTENQEEDDGSIR